MLYDKKAVAPIFTPVLILTKILRIFVGRLTLQLLTCFKVGVVKRTDHVCT